MFCILETTDNENQFVVAILSDLRKDNFGFQAWIHFLVGSWKKSRTTAKTHPSLANSWFSITIIFGLLALAILLFNLFFEGPLETLHVLPFFLSVYVWLIFAFTLRILFCYNATQEQRGQERMTLQ